MRTRIATILTASSMLVAALVSGCNSGCVQLGSTNVSTCSGTTSSTTPANSISGGVSGTALNGVQISLTGAASANTTTNSSGTYSFPRLPAGNYTLTPALAGYTFKPASSTVTLVSGAASTGNNFVESAYTGETSSVSGRVIGALALNAIVRLSGANTGSAVTDANGNYSFGGLAAGSYTLTPSLAGYVFSPASHAATTDAGEAITGNNFTAAIYAAPTSSLSGTVSGAIAQNVTIKLSGANTGSVMTDEDGKYSFAGLVPGSYTVTPSFAGYTFSPASRTLIMTSSGSFTLENFAALP